MSTISILFATRRSFLIISLLVRSISGPAVPAPTFHHACCEGDNYDYKPGGTGVDCNNSGNGPEASGRECRCRPGCCESGHCKPRHDRHVGNGSNGGRGPSPGNGAHHEHGCTMCAKNNGGRKRQGNDNCNRGTGAGVDCDVDSENKNVCATTERKCPGNNNCGRGNICNEGCGCNACRVNHGGGR